MTLPFNATDYYAQRTTRPGLKPVTTGSFGGGDTISGYWDGGPSGGATNTNGPYTNPGMGPKPLPGPQGSGGGGSGRSSRTPTVRLWAREQASQERAPEDLGRPPHYTYHRAGIARLTVNRA